MNIERSSSRYFALGTCFSLSLLATAALAQPGGFGIDSRAERRTYVFEETGEELPYCVFVSSKVKENEPAPLIIALHGMGATPDIMCNTTAVDLAEEGGYILAAPMGYNTTGWFGSPVINMGGAGRGNGPGRGGNAAPGGNAPGRGAMGPAMQMSFDGINAAANGAAADDHLTADEVRAFFANAAAGRGGAAGPGGRAGGAPGAAGGDFVGDMFASWDADSDGKVTRTEFDNRPAFNARGQGAGNAPAVAGRGGRGAGAPPAAAAGGRGAGGGGGGFGGGAPAPENLAELSEKDVLNVLGMMREQFNVDAKRIYLTGHSMGGAGTYYLGAEHADVWAAIAPVAPAAFMMTGNRAELLKKLADADVPVMVVHGADDEVVNVSISRDQWVPTLAELGIEHEYVEQPGITHGPVITSSQEDIFRFFGAHSK